MVPDRNGRERHTLRRVPYLFGVERDTAGTAPVHIDPDVVQSVVVATRDKQAAVNLSPAAERRGIVSPLSRRRVTLGRIHDDDQTVPFDTPTHRQRALDDEYAPTRRISANRTVAAHDHNDR